MKVSSLRIVVSSFSAQWDLNCVLRKERKITKTKWCPAIIWCKIQQSARDSLVVLGRESISAQVLLLAVRARNLKIEGLIVAFPVYNPDL